MTEHILIGIVSVIVLGIGAQWLAWRIRVPSILLLLVFGFLAGPVTGLLPPESLQGDWLFAFVSLSIGIILFEGGLSLRISELREVGKSVLNLITIGVLVTWALASLAAYYVAGFNPMVFLVIVGTVAVYGLTISPLARYLGLADPNPQGMLFLGAYLWVQRIAMALQERGFKVLLIDANTKNIDQAKENNLPAETADALSEAVIDELDLSGIGRLLALTPNDEVNALAALHFTEVFENNEVYQLAARPGSQRDRQGELPEHLRGRPLFGESTTHASLSKRFNDGGEIRTFDLTEEASYEKLRARYDDDVVLLFIVRGTNLLVHAEENQITPQPGDTVIVMLPPFSKERDLADEAFFEDLVAHAFVVDLDEAATYSEIVRQASILFAQRLPIAAGRLSKGLLESTRYGGAPISQGVALPHYRIPRILQRPDDSDHPLRVSVRGKFRIRERAGLTYARPSPGVGVRSPRAGHPLPSLSMKDSRRHR